VGNLRESLLSRGNSDLRKKKGKFQRSFEGYGGELVAVIVMLMTLEYDPSGGSDPQQFPRLVPMVNRSWKKQSVPFSWGCRDKKL
jgi:hypothetical protein